MFQEIEPFHGWLHIYNQANDRRNPFREVEHNAFHYDRFIYTYPAHPLWESIESESLLIKVLYANYRRGFAVIELLGEWNDLFQNDFKLLCENCLYPLLHAGITNFVLICDNVFNIYIQNDEYYADLYDMLEDGWICLLNPRPNIVDELHKWRVDGFFRLLYDANAIRWRKMKPWDLFYRADNLGLSALS
jgi:hypothetical protein